MNDRIIQLIAELGYSQSKFAEEIGIQRSNISHVVKGRNKPSAEFLSKLVTRFDNINVNWILTGKGSMYNNVINTDLKNTTKSINKSKQANKDINDKTNSLQNTQSEKLINKNENKDVDIFKHENNSNNNSIHKVNESSSTSSEKVSELENNTSNLNKISNISQLSPNQIIVLYDDSTFKTFHKRD